jgi:hypothetical protein
MSEPINPFFTAAASTVDAAAAMCHESFTVVRNGNEGTYEAVSIEELTIEAGRVPGGRVSEATDGLYVKQCVMDAAALAVGTVLTVRGRKLRILTMHDDGDAVQFIQCGPAGGNSR